MSPAQAKPLVSVYIPAFNAEDWIEEAIGSALEQTYPNIEVVVVDDASTDATLARARSIRDSRLRVEANPVNLGHSGNWSHSVTACRGEFLKFLSADDLLLEGCVEALVDVMSESSSIGMAFCRRRIEIDERAAPGGEEWRERYSRLHLRFGSLDRVNSGRDLFEIYMRAGFDDNWIGELSNVMMRRSAFEALGGFNPRIRQAADMDVWIRSLFFFDIGFVDQVLSVYRLVPNSLSESNRRTRSNFLDKVWLLEGLLADERIASAYPELSDLRRAEAWRAWRSGLALSLASGGGKDRLAELLAYTRHHMRDAR